MALKKIRGAHIRKINHYRRVISKTLINIRQVWPGDIIEFRYRGTDIFDPIPLVFVIKKEQKIIQGLNLNYLKEHNVQKIFDETDWIRLIEGKVRRDVKGARAKYYDLDGYVRHMQYYLKHGDWIDSQYGEFQEKSIKWRTIVTAGN